MLIAAAEVDAIALSANAVQVQTPNRFLIGGAGLALFLVRPSPPPSPPMPPPSPPSPPAPPMKVIGLGCALSPLDGRCVRSSGYGGAGYSDNEACTIINPPTVPISVTSFEVEWYPFLSGCIYDYLTVNGVRYCGTSPEGVVPDGTPIEWVTDASVTLAGWEICFPLPPSSSLPPPSPPSPPSPSPPPPPPSSEPPCATPVEG